MTRPTFNTSQLNALDQQAFVAAIGFVFEDTPELAAEAWHARPFASSDDLFAALTAVLDQQSAAQKLALIRAHPDLVGRAALAGTLGAESTSEQASVGLNRLSPDEIATFRDLNAAYWSRFDFPFVICVRENKKAGILDGFRVRLGNTRDAEIATAIGEIKKIAALRLADVVRP